MGLRWLFCPYSCHCCCCLSEGSWPAVISFTWLEFKPVIYKWIDSLLPMLFRALSLVQLFALGFQREFCKSVFSWHFTGYLGKENYHRLLPTLSELPSPWEEGPVPAIQGRSEGFGLSLAAADMALSESTGAARAASPTLQGSSLLLPAPCHSMPPCPWQEQPGLSS